MKALKKHIGVDLWLACLMGISLIAILLSQNTQYDFLYNRASIFSLFYLAVGLLAFFFNYRKLMFIGLGLSAVVCIMLKNDSNVSLKLPQIVSKEDNFSISHYNLAYISDTEKLIKFIAENPSDIISFQELTPGINEYLIANLTPFLPYSYINVRIDPFGKSIFSKFPIYNTKLISDQSTEDVAVSINIFGENYTIISTYLTPSLGKRLESKANQQLSNIVNLLNVDNIENKIVLGEFNMVYWSDPIREFRSKTHLQNSRRQAPINGTVPFDHIFYSNNLDCTYFEELVDKEYGKIGIRGVYQTKNSLMIGSL